MIIFPAIDLFEGKAVRLLKGDYDKKTVYSDDPLSVALSFRDAGAEAIHLVDLEGAKDGTTPNFEIIRRIREKTGLFTETGGGVRDLKTVEKYVDSGIDRVIIGTAAVTDGEFLKKAAEKYPGRIAVSADVREGSVAIRGWVDDSGVMLEDFLRRMADLGIDTAICTDISRDGAMKGTNLMLYKKLSESFGMNLIASGGVSTLSDVRSLAEMDIYGAIIGKALYTGAIDLSQAIGAAQSRGTK